MSDRVYCGSSKTDSLNVEVKSKERRRYVSPDLLHYGSVATLTQGSKAVATDPGGSGRKNP